MQFEGAEACSSFIKQNSLDFELEELSLRKYVIT